MDDDWSEVRRKAAERKAEHVKRLKASAMFSLEVYVSNVMLDKATNESNPRIRFKFSDFACVEIPSRDEAMENDDTGCAASSPTSSPTTTTTTATTTVEASKAASKENVTEELPKADNDQSVAPVPPSEYPSSASLLKPHLTKYVYRIDSKMRRDPRYFDPRKLLRHESQSIPTEFTKDEEAEAADDQGIDVGRVAVEDAGRVGQEDAGKAAKEEPDDATEVPESEQKDQPEGSESPRSMSPSYSELEETEEYEVSRCDQPSFDNGKSLVFCMEPITLIRDLIRRPLCLIVLCKREVVGLAKLGLQSLTDAIDKSVALARSVPLSGIIVDTVDVKFGEKKVGYVDVEVRLTCFGATVLHRIYVKDNPNDEHLELEDAGKSTRHSPSQRLIVVPMNLNKMPLFDSKNKPTRTKSYPSLQGHVQRDISDFPPFVCGDEHIPQPSAKPERELSTVEKQEKDKAAARIAELTKFPQYNCVGDWEIIFTRNVIKELIAKNRCVRCRNLYETSVPEGSWQKCKKKKKKQRCRCRDFLSSTGCTPQDVARRPFQKGSPDRIYVERHFPELLPPSDPQKPKPGKARHPAKKTKKSDPGHDFGILPLDQAWVKEGEISRIRRRSVRPQVRTSSSPAASSVTTFAGRPHTMTSMSHVAVDRFNMEKGDFDHNCDDSRIVPMDSTTAVSDKSGPRGLHRKRTDHQSEADVGPRLFDLKHPRIDQSLEKFNPIPELPLTVEIDAPERAPADKFVQAIRTMNKDVDTIGCDILLAPPLGTAGGQGSSRNLAIQEKTSGCRLHDSDSADTFLVQVGRGVPILVPARSTPYWEGHVPACSDPVNCRHYLIFHPGYGFFGR